MLNKMWTLFGSDTQVLKITKNTKILIIKKKLYLQTGWNGSIDIITLLLHNNEIW